MLHNRFKVAYNKEIAHALFGVGGMLTGSIFYLSIIGSFLFPSRFIALLVLVCCMEVFSIILINRLPITKTENNN